MNINPGEFNKRIKIISIGGTADADGYITPVRTTVWECYAKFSRTSGTELIKSNADFADVKVRFLMRMPPVAIDRKMIIEYVGVDYEIEYTNDYADSHEYVEIFASRVTNG